MTRRILAQGGLSHSLELRQEETLSKYRNSMEKERIINKMKSVKIYTDGACLGNPGPGGWCAILIYGKVEKELTGGDKHTTNNRMEITAVIQGLRALKEACRVEIFSDSKYVVDAFNKRWIFDWERRGWQKADRQPVKNQDLWYDLLALARIHEVKFHHVAGHSGHKYNERCDSLAQDFADSIFS